MESHARDSCQGRSREPATSEVAPDAERSVLANARRLLIVFAAEAIKDRTLGDPSEIGVEALAELRELAAILNQLDLPALGALLDEEELLLGPAEAIASGSG